MGLQDIKSIRIKDILNNFDKLVIKEHDCSCFKIGYVVTIEIENIFCIDILDNWFTEPSGYDYIKNEIFTYCILNKKFNSEKFLNFINSIMQFYLVFTIDRVKFYQYEKMSDGNLCKVVTLEYER